MPRPLPEGLVAPGHTVLVSQECQNGVIGALTGMPDLAEEARVAIRKAYEDAGMVGKALVAV